MKEREGDRRSGGIDPLGGRRRRRAALHRTSRRDACLDIAITRNEDRSGRGRYSKAGGTTATNKAKSILIPVIFFAR